MLKLQKELTAQRRKERGATVRQVRRVCMLKCMHGRAWLVATGRTAPAGHNSWDITLLECPSSITHEALHTLCQVEA